VGLMIYMHRFVVKESLNEGVLYCAGMRVYVIWQLYRIALMLSSLFIPGFHLDEETILKSFESN